MLPSPSHPHPPRLLRQAQAQVAADRHGKAAARDGNAAARDAAGSGAGEEAAGPSGGKGGRAGGGQVRQGLAWDYRAKADPHGDDSYVSARHHA
jgi:hypothetical protein